MAATLLPLSLHPVRPAAAERHCPIPIISVHLLDVAGQLLRLLFLDHQATGFLEASGHITAQPHYVPKAVKPY